MSFIFRRSEDSGEQAEQDELSRLYLSSTDLFCLLGGPEARLLSCGDIRLPRTNDDNLQRKRDAWLGKLIKRLEPQGWVDVEGNPNDELRNALEALRDPCLVISEHPRYIQPTFVIAVTATEATGLVAAQGPVGWGRWSLRPFPSDDRTIWSAYFRDIVPENSFPFFPAERSYHAAWVEDVPGELLGFIRSGAVRKAREYAARAGIDAGVVGKLAASAAADQMRFHVSVNLFGSIDASSTPDPETTAAHEFPRYRTALVLPSLGAVLSDCHAWNPGVPDDWFYVDDDDPERKEVLELTRFLSFDTHRSGRLFEALSYVPTYPTSIIPR